MVAPATDESELPKDYFAIQKWAMSLMGLSVDPNTSILYKIYSYGLVGLSLLYCVLVLTNTWRDKEEFFDFEEYINTWMFITGYIVITTKLVSVFLQRPKLHLIFNLIQTGVFIPSIKRGGEVELVLKKDCINLTRKLAIVSLIVGLVTTVACVSASLALYFLKGYRKLPFGSVLMLTDNLNYKVAFMYQAIIYGIAIEVFMINDVVFAALLAHITAQCKILQNFIRRLTELSRSDMLKDASSETNPASSEEAVPYKYLQRQLKEVVLHHIAVLHAAEKVEEVFNIPTLGVYIGMSICFCFIMYQGSLYPFLDLRFLKDFLILFTATLPLAINSFWGSEVTFESLSVADACYEIDFVGTDVKFQQFLVLMIQRSQKPIKLTVGKFAVLSLVSMLSLMRVSYSYFMILRRVNDK